MDIEDNGVDRLISGEMLGNGGLKWLVVITQLDC